MLAAPHKLVIWTVFALIVGGYALMAVQFPLAFIWATYEDLVGEWAQTYFFLAAAILSILVARPRSRYRWFFIVLAIACSYVFLEEISWGQRIFGFETPEYLKARNLQGEANLHNLFTGPHKTVLKDLISIGVAIGRDPSPIGARGPPTCAETGLASGRPCRESRQNERRRAAMLSEGAAVA